jgi:hypothetical protein
LLGCHAGHVDPKQEEQMTDRLVLHLNSRHSVLEQEINREMAAPLPNSIRITMLKKEKLRLRDRLHSLSRARTNAAPAMT